MSPAPHTHCKSDTNTFCPAANSGNQFSLLYQLCLKPVFTTPPLPNLIPDHSPGTAGVSFFPRGSPFSLPSVPTCVTWTRASSPHASTRGPDRTGDLISSPPASALRATARVAPFAESLICVDRELLKTKTQTSMTSCCPHSSHWLLCLPFKVLHEQAPASPLSNTCPFLKYWAHCDSFLSCLKQTVPLSAITQILSSSGPPNPLSLISTPKDTPIVPGARLAQISADRLSHCDLRLSMGTVFSWGTMSLVSTGL